MPELHFAVRWPNGTRETYYSPSTVVREFFVAGINYELADFLSRSRRALGAASERVRVRYGAPCSLALGQLARIETTAARFADQPNAHVFFETFQE